MTRVRAATCVIALGAGLALALAAHQVSMLRLPLGGTYTAHAQASECLLYTYDSADEPSGRCGSSFIGISDGGHVWASDLSCYTAGAYSVHLTVYTCGTATRVWAKGTLSNGDYTGGVLTQVAPNRWEWTSSCIYTPGSEPEQWYFKVEGSNWDRIEMQVCCCCDDICQCGLYLD